jgi:hypothetical protein
MQHLFKNILGYSLLLAFICILLLPGCQKDLSTQSIKANDLSKINAPASSSIIYTDVKPDKLLQGSSLYDIKTYHLDLNNDGKNDYDLQTSQRRAPCAGHAALASYVQIICYGTNSLGDSIPGDPVPISSGRSINQNEFIWNGQGVQVLARYTACNNSHIGLWSGLSDKYLPLRLVVGSSVYFGWLRLDVGINGIYVTIKDYAYNATSNQTILAGQTK